MIDLNNVAVDDALNFDPSGNLMALVNDLGLTDVDLAGALDVSQAFANEVLVIGGEFAKTAARTLLAKLNARDDLLMHAVDEQAGRRVTGVDLAEVVRAVVLTEVNRRSSRPGVVNGDHLLTNSTPGESVLDQAFAQLSRLSGERSTRAITRAVVTYRAL